MFGRLKAWFGGKVIVKVKREWQDRPLPQIVDGTEHLPPHDRLKILEATREFLGPNGENWIRSAWWKKRGEDGRLLDYDPVTGEDFDPLDCDCGCLAGAAEISAARLGYKPKPVLCNHTVSVISLLTAARKYLGSGTAEVWHLNDSYPWEVIRDVLDEKIADTRKTLETGW